MSEQPDDQSGPFEDPETDPPRMTDEEFETELAYWRPLYEGEKLAGLLPHNF